MAATYKPKAWKILGLLPFFFVLGITGDRTPSGSPAISQPTENRVAQAESPEVRIITSSGKKISLTVELASTPAEWQTGLMFRRNLAPQSGMLFLFPAAEERSFWMKNTLIPLDIIFLNSQREIVGIIPAAEPRSLTALTVPAPSQYVLEVNGGFCERMGIAKGDFVEFVGMH